MIFKNICFVSLLSILLINLSLLSAADMPTDEQITKILTTNNDGEIAMAKLAEKKASTKVVKKFAKELYRDHSKNNKKTIKLSHKMEMIPADTPKAMEIQAASKKNIADLEGLKGKEFDKAYMNIQVQAHQKTLEDLDNTLIPSAKNAKLKRQLEKTRKTVAEHLEDAKGIVQKL